MYDKVHRKWIVCKLALLTYMICYTQQPLSLNLVIQPALAIRAVSLGGKLIWNFWKLLTIEIKSLQDWVERKRDQNHVKRFLLIYLWLKCKCCRSRVNYNF